MLWAIVADLDMRYGPLRRIWLHAMGHCGRFSSALWVIAKDLLKRYGPWRSIWLCAMGQSTEPITTAQNYITVFKSLPYPLKGL
jgi:hypothetical protein